ncbi:DUF2934 domain-containing protein [Caldichromatium japonicum]|uniref:DUF2934 domain-containing protein n=1 Tax=Caldichromatium japonicum TaxID=2699430 RepID=A0A6G7VA79_9GAMM|nr:DUF2934 domain-containing protein [Caldichromatium japonicum]QIK36969.1 DUF2934 domain-containing protein [Caldichromatium japonicum]
MSDPFAHPSPEQRHEMIAVAAYYLAERRGFAPGHAEADWLRAEQVIDALIASRSLRAGQDQVEQRQTIRNALILRQAEIGV